VPLIASMGLNELVETDHTYRDHALISLSMYNLAHWPAFVGIWAEPQGEAGDNAPVRPRTFKIDWESADITAHGLERRYPTLVATTAWAFQQPRSLLVFEQFDEESPWPQVITTSDPSFYHKNHQRSVITGLDMAVQRTAKPTSDPLAPKLGAIETYQAVIYPPPEDLEGKALPRTLFNVIRHASVKDKTSGLGSFGPHRAVMRGWSRGHHAIPYPKNVSGNRRQVTVHYQDDTFKKWRNDMTEEFDCGTPIEGPIKDSQLQERLLAGAARGQWPIRVGANGSVPHARFMITWAPQGRLFPLKRYDVVVDGVSPTKRRITVYAKSVASSVAGLASTRRRARARYRPTAQQGSSLHASTATSFTRCTCTVPTLRR
jgi:hypothetical protein